MAGPSSRLSVRSGRVAVLAALCTALMLAAFAMAPSLGAQPPQPRAQGTPAAVHSHPDLAFGGFGLPPDAAPTLRAAAPAIAFGTLVSAATLCACFAAFAFGQRRFGFRLEATLADLEYTSTQMRGAAGLSRESAATVTRLAGAAADAEQLLRGWIDTAEASQEKAAALAAKCTRLADALPELMTEAVANIQARSQAGMDEAAGRLDRRALEIAAAAAALQDGARRFTDTAAAQSAQQDEAASLIRHCDAAIAALPETVGDTLVTIQARGQAAIDAAASRLVGSAADIDAAALTLRNVAHDATRAAVGEAEARAQAGLLARQCAELAETLPQTMHEAVTSAGRRGMDAAEAAHLRLQDSALCIEAAAAELTSRSENSAATIAAQIIRLDEAANRADAVARSLPEVTTHLAEGAAAMRRESQHGAQLLSEAQVEVARVAEDMAAAAAAAETGLERLTHAATAQEAASARAAEGVAAMTACAGALDAAGSALCARLAAQAAQTQDVVTRLEAAVPFDLAERLGGAAAMLERLAISLHDQADGLAARTRDHAAQLAALGERAGQAAAMLPDEAGKLAAEAASLRTEASSIAASAAAITAAQDNHPGIPPEALAQAVSGLADGTARLSAELDAARATLENGVSGLVAAASRVRQDAAETGAALARRDAEDEAGQTARLMRVEHAALAAIARLDQEAAARQSAQDEARHGELDDAALATAMAGMLAQLGAATAATESASAWLNTLFADARTGGRKLADLRRAATQIAGATMKLSEASAWQDQAAINVAKAAGAVAAAAQPPLTVLDNLRTG